MTALCLREIEQHENVPQALRRIARDVRRIGSAWRDDPETIVTQKDQAASELVRLARRLVGGIGFVFCVEVRRTKALWAPWTSHTLLDVVVDLLFG